MTKLLTIYFDGGVFSQIFDDPYRRNYGWDPKKFGTKMLARITSITVQNLVEIARRTSAWEDEMWCFSLFIYVCNAPALNGHKLRSCFIEERIALVFLGRFRCRLQLFGDEKPFTMDKTNLKIVARRRYYWCDNARKFSKSEKMSAKFVRTTSTI